MRLAGTPPAASLLQPSRYFQHCNFGSSFRSTGNDHEQTRGLHLLLGWQIFGVTIELTKIIQQTPR